MNIFNSIITASIFFVVSCSASLAVPQKNVPVKITINSSSYECVVVIHFQNMSERNVELRHSSYYKNGRLDGDAFELSHYEGSYKYLGVTADYQDAESANNYIQQLLPNEIVEYKIDFCSHYKLSKVNQDIQVALYDHFMINGESMVIKSNTIKFKIP